MEESKKVRRLEDNIGNAGSLYRCDRIAKKNVLIFTSFMKDRLYITEIEATRKSKEDERYLLFTANAYKDNAQHEVDNLLGKYYKRRQEKLDPLNL